VTDLQVPTPGSGRRSGFVTVVAWLFLVLSGLATLGALLQLLALVVAPAEVSRAVNRVAQDTAVTQLLPWPYMFMLHHVHLVALIKLTWWAVVLVTSIGVLRRQEWARRTFVAVFAIGISGHRGVPPESIDTDVSGRPDRIDFGKRSGAAGYGLGYGARGLGHGRCRGDLIMVAPLIPLSPRA
jgi:hypothetical protein